MSGPQVFLDGRVRLHAGDCLDVLAGLPENSIDAIVTDPPYHLTSIVKRFGPEGATPSNKGRKNAYGISSSGFMGKAWDGGDIAFRPQTWAACLRVLKPGGWLAAFASTRGFGRMQVAIEDAGFVSHPLIAHLTESANVREFFAMLDHPQRAAFARLLAHHDTGGMLGWLFGSGFPKATKVNDPAYAGFAYGGQALKPAIEPICLAQKPFAERNGTENVRRWGTGALAIDACRVGWQSEADAAAAAAAAAAAGFADSRAAGKTLQSHSIGKESRDGESAYDPQAISGRHPANLTHDGSAEALSVFPETGPAKAGQPRAGAAGDGWGMTATGAEYDDAGGSAARFFYCAKAGDGDRLGSKHPTVKPVDLMRWLVRLAVGSAAVFPSPLRGGVGVGVASDSEPVKDTPTPPADAGAPPHKGEGGAAPRRPVVLDPFAGTGTTAEAAWLEGFDAILIEREAEYRADIAARMELLAAGPDTRAREAMRRKLEGRGIAPDLGPLFSGSPSASEATLKDGAKIGGGA